MNSTNDMVKHPNHYQGNNGIEAREVLEGFAPLRNMLRDFIGEILSNTFCGGTTKEVLKTLKKLEKTLII